MKRTIGGAMFVAVLALLASALWFGTTPPPAQADYTCSGSTCNATPTPGPCCGFSTIQNQRTPLPHRPTLDCEGGVLCTDDGFHHVTTLTGQSGYRVIQNNGAAVTPRTVLNLSPKLIASDNPVSVPPSTNLDVAYATVNVIAPIAGDGSPGNPLTLGTLLEGQKIQMGQSVDTGRLLADVGSQFGPISNSGSSETTAFDHIIHGNAFDSNGKWIRISAAGRTAANGNSKTIKLYYGPFGNVVAHTTTANNKAWECEAKFMRISTTQSVGSAHCLVGAELPSVAAGAPATIFDFTSDFELKITITGVSSGDITGDYAILEFANR